MWIKAISLLSDLAPQIKQLGPLLDRFSQSKAAGEESTRRAVDAMAEGLRGDLSQVSASHETLYRELNNQSEKLSTMASQLNAVTAAADSVETRLTHIERRTSLQTKLLALSGVLNIAVIVLLVMALFHHR